MTQLQLIKAVRKRFDIFSKLFVKIKTKQMGVVPFKFKRLQTRLWEWAMEDLIAGKPIRWDILKSRQIGSSTFFVLYIFWNCVLHKGRNALIVAHDIASATNLHDMAKLAFTQLPDFLKPEEKTSNRRELFFASNKGDGGLQSKISIDTSDNENLGASRTLHLVLLSEIARYEQIRDPKVLMTTLNQAVPYRPGTAIIRESTAKGFGYWRDQWYDTKSGYRKIFISYVADEEYRLEIDPKDYPTLSDIEKSHYGDEVLEHELIKKEVILWYPEFDPNTVEGMQRINHEVMCRLVWRRWCIDNQCERDKGYFRQEYPVTPEQAFIGSGDQVFDEEILAEMAHKTETLTPQRFHFDTQAINIGKGWWDRAFKSSEYGNLSVYERPRDGARYVIGADPSYGISDGDKSAAVVLRLPELVEVATFNESMSPDFFGDLLYALGKLYNNALLGVEAFGPGASTINRLWHGLYYENLYYRESKYDKITRNMTDALGWNTNNTTKAVLITTGKKVVKLRQCSLQNQETIRQMRMYSQLNNGDFGAPEGEENHDDLVIAFLIGVQMALQVHIPDKSNTPSAPPRFSPEGLWQRIKQKQSMGRNYGEVKFS